MKEKQKLPYFHYLLLPLPWQPHTLLYRCEINTNLLSVPPAFRKYIVCCIYFQLLKGYITQCQYMSKNSRKKALGVKGLTQVFVSTYSCLCCWLFRKLWEFFVSWIYAYVYFVCVVMINLLNSKSWIFHLWDLHTCILLVSATYTGLLIIMIIITMIISTYIVLLLRACSQIPVYDLTGRALGGWLAEPGMGFCGQNLGISVFHA